MKKVYSILCVSLLAFGSRAQQNLKVKCDRHSTETKRTVAFQRGPGSSNSPMQVAATITANSGYVAGSTMNINFTILTTNADAEYIDSLAFTFPSTFTVNSSPNDPFPTADNGGGAETLNGVNGQTISWGVNNNDQYGGIWANPAQSFDINVSIAAGTTGPQVIHYFASGDTYGGAPGDYADSITLVPAQQFDAQLVGISQIGVACDLSANQVITARIKNFGYDTIRGFAASYRINNGVPVLENPTDTILPGDTLTYSFVTTANLSAPNMYHIWVGASATGDGNTSNDSASIDAVNYAPTNIAGSPETMGFEAGADSVLLTTWTVADNNADGATWALINTYNHSGSRCIRKPGSAASDDDWLFTNCLDLQSANTYKLEYYYKNFDIATPCSLEVKIGTDNNVAAMTSTLVKNPIPGDTMYQYVVILFNVPADSTYHLGFHAYATAGTSSIRIDDINISMSPVGIGEINAKTLSVYPNPAYNVLYVNASQNGAQVEIFSMVGEKMTSKMNLSKGSNALDISTLADGTYLVRILNGAQVTTKKIVVAR